MPELREKDSAIVDAVRESQEVLSDTLEETRAKVHLLAEQLWKLDRRVCAVEARRTA